MALARATGVRVPGPPPVTPVALPGDATVVVHTNRGDFTLSLDGAAAPLAVARFLELARADELDNDIFHRVVPGFVVQTGCPRGDGWGGVSPTLPDEPTLDPFDAGAVGIARSDPDSGSSQWFVTLSDQPHLVGDYTRIGEIVQGAHVVGRLSAGDRVIDVEVLP
jgi:cyclophilin family peptidyl-prolyl cis-trans isomerase